jgi:hypothetical protein
MNNKKQYDGYGFFSLENEKNLPPAFFENPESYKEREGYTEYDIHAEERNISFDKYYSETKLSDVDYTDSGLRNSATKGVQDKDLYSNVYFSKANTELIQKRIRREVYEKSKFLIDNQNETELLIIMRSFHIQHARNLNNCSSEMIKNEIKRIDDMVVNFCVPRVVNEVRQYFHYLSDASTMPMPIEHPKLVSNAGVKSLNPSLSIPFNRNFS